MEYSYNTFISEGAQLSSICRQLKYPAKDGKNRLTDVARTKQLLRIIWSIPYKKSCQ